MRATQALVYVCVRECRCAWKRGGAKGIRYARLFACSWKSHSAGPGWVADSSNDSDSDSGGDGANCRSQAEKNAGATLCTTACKHPHNRTAKQQCTDTRPHTCTRRACCPRNAQPKTATPQHHTTMNDHHSQEVTPTRKTQATKTNREWKEEWKEEWEEEWKEEWTQPTEAAAQADQHCSTTTTTAAAAAAAHPWLPVVPPSWCVAFTRSRYAAGKSVDDAGAEDTGGRA